MAQKHRRNPAQFRTVLTILFVLAIIILSTSFSVFFILMSKEQHLQQIQNQRSTYTSAVTWNSLRQLTSLLFQHQESPSPSSTSSSSSSNSSCFTWTNFIQTKEYNSCDVEPIDAVYTWVNGSDPLHLKARLRFLSLLTRNSTSPVGPPVSAASGASHATPSSSTSFSLSNSTNVTNSDNDDDRASANRFADNDELRYSLRGLEQYAGSWIRHVYIVTNGQVPSWLDLSHPKVSIVTHMEVFSRDDGDGTGSFSLSHLPVFSSNSIESHIHRIPSLSAKFLYLNDDTFFGAKVLLDDFYCPVAGHKLYFSWAIPLCAEGCQPGWIGDKYCDHACNTEGCDWDGGDCDAKNKGSTLFNSEEHVLLQQRRTQEEEGLRARECAPGCNMDLNWIGDRFCDKKCNFSSCGFDGGDCGLDEIFTRYKEGRLIHNLLSSASTSGDGYEHQLDRRCRVPSNSSTSCNRTIVVPSSTTFLDFDLNPDDSSTVSVLFNMSDVFFFEQTDDGNNTSYDDDNDSSEINKTNNNMKLQTAYFDASPGSGCHDLIRSSVYSADSSSLILVFPSRNKFASVFDSRANMTNFSSSLSSSCLATFEFRVKEFFDVELNLNFSFHQIFRDVAEAMVTRKSLLIEQLNRRTQTAVGNNDGGDDDLPSSRENHPATKDLLADSSMRRSDHEAVINGIDGIDDGETAQQQQQRQHHQQDRELLDSFGDSLKWSNRLLNRRFGKQAQPRKAPAHMVHLIERNVIDTLWSLYPNEWRNTSASRFRSGDNIQYGFVHMYYLMHARKSYVEEEEGDEGDEAEDKETRGQGREYERPSSRKKSPKKEIEFFSRYLDVDGSGYVEEYELRRIGLLLYEKQVPLETLLESNVQRSVVVAPGIQATSASASTTNSNDTSTASTFCESQPENSTSLSLNASRRDVSVDEASDDGDDDLNDDPRDEPTGYVLLAEEKVVPMSRRYYRAVADLVGQASAGVKYDLCVDEDRDQELTKRTTASTPRGRRIVLTPSAFRKSHLAKLLTPLFSEVEPEYPTELQTLDDVTFFMVRDNATVVRHQMDHIIQKRPKFFCINDNMNRTRKGSFPKVQKLLGDFLEQYFPHRSSFEKRDEEQQRDAVEYIWQHVPWIRKIQKQEDKTMVSAAFARALQHGFTFEEFEQDKKKWIDEFEKEVLSLSCERDDQDGGATKNNDTVDDDDESVLFILTVSGFFTSSVILVLLYIKCYGST